MKDFPKAGKPENYPGVVRCRGGWFAVQQAGDLGSGPWKTEDAAKAALARDYERAWQIEREKQP